MVRWKDGRTMRWLVRWMDEGMMDMVGWLHGKMDEYMEDEMVGWKYRQDGMVQWKIGWRIG